MAAYQQGFGRLLDASIRIADIAPAADRALGPTLAAANTA
jgi:hypothetical protein